MAQEALGRNNMSLKMSCQLARLYPLDPWILYSVSYYQLKLSRPLQALSVFLTSASLHKSEVSTVWKVKGYTILRMFNETINILMKTQEIYNSFLFSSMLALNLLRNKNKEMGEKYLDIATGIYSTSTINNIDDCIYYGSSLIEAGRFQDSVNFYEQLVKKGNSQPVFPLQ